MRISLLARLAAGILSLAPFGTRIASAQPVFHFVPAPSSLDDLGSSVAIVGEHVVAGSPDGNRAWVFDRQSGAHLHTLNGMGASFGFATSLAAVGNEIAIGSPLDDSGPGIGAVDLYDPSSGALVRSIHATTSTCSNCSRNFGTALAAANGNVLVGSAIEAVAGQSWAGRAHLFDAATGTLLLTLESPSPVGTSIGQGNFGRAVGALGADLLVGAPRDQPSPGVVGAVYLFDGTTGALLRRFDNPAAPSSTTDRFGDTIGVVSGNVIVGAPGSGSVYLFDAATGALLRTFANPCPTCSLFGTAVAGFGGRVFVGSPFDDVDGEDVGAVHVFDAATGAHVRRFLNPTPTLPDPTQISNDFFGASLAVSDGSIMVGAPQDEGAATGIFFTNGTGAAYLFYGGIAGCGPCETAGPLGTCAVAPHGTCRPSLDAGARLKITNDGNDARDRVSWSWRGRALTIGDFGYPDLHDATLCVWDESGPAAALLFRALAPAGVGCGSGSSCWTSSLRSNRVTYRDADPQPEGVSTMRLLGGAAQGRLMVRGKGPSLSSRPLGLSPLPPPLPLRVQLQAANGLCWESTHTVARTSTATRFSSPSD